MNTGAIEAAGAGPLRQVIEEVRLAVYFSGCRKHTRPMCAQGCHFFFPIEDGSLS